MILRSILIIFGVFWLSPGHSKINPQPGGTLQNITPDQTTLDTETQVILNSPYSRVSYVLKSTYGSHHPYINAMNAKYKSLDRNATFGKVLQSLEKDPQAGPASMANMEIIGLCIMTAPYVIQFAWESVKRHQERKSQAQKPSSSDSSGSKKNCDQEIGQLYQELFQEETQLSSVPVNTLE